MTENRIRVLLDRVLNKCSSDAEEAELLALLEDESFQAQITPTIKKIWDENCPQQILSPQEIEGMAHRIFDLTKTPPAKPAMVKTVLRSLYTGWFKYAAVLFVIFYVSLHFFKSRKSGHKTDSISQLALTSGKIKPGKNRAILTLADGSSIDLGSANAGVLQSKSGTSIIKSAQGELLYKTLDKTSGSQAVNIISTPRGGQYSVVLSDGTRVSLNAESSLTYPLTFSGNERIVKLTGEGYFEVSKNSEKPFKVEVGTIQVSVLGTHFNVRYYENDPQVRTTLLEGSVKIANGRTNALLTPGEQGEWEPNRESFVVGASNVEQAIAWKDGYFIFEGTRLSTILTELSRWYDFDFELDPVIANKKFSATILRTTSFSQVLEMLEMTKEVSFKVNGRKIQALN